MVVAGAAQIDSHLHLLCKMVLEDNVLNMVGYHYRLNIVGQSKRQMLSEHSNSKSNLQTTQRSERFPHDPRDPGRSSSLQFSPNPVLPPRRKDANQLIRPFPARLCTN